MSQLGHNSEKKNISTNQQGGGQLFIINKTDYCMILMNYAQCADMVLLTGELVQLFTARWCCTILPYLLLHLELPNATQSNLRNIQDNYLL